MNRALANHLGSTITIVLFSCLPARAGLIASGQMAQTAPPPSVVPGDFESDTTLFVFQERSNVVLTSDLTVDVNIPGTYGPNTTGSSFPQGVIPAGTEVDSYFLHGDHVGGGRQQLSGAVTFDRTILGVIFTTNRLRDTHALLGAPTTLYGTGGFNITSSLSDDQFSLSPDRRTLTMNADIGSGADNIRVVTSSSVMVPEPRALALLLGLTPVAAIHRRFSTRAIAGVPDF